MKGGGRSIKRKRSKTTGLKDKETQSENKEENSGRETAGRGTQEVHAEVDLLTGFENLNVCRCRLM